MRWSSLISVVLASTLFGGSALAQGAEKPSSNAVHHYIEGQRYLREGSIEAAEAELEEAVRLDPDYLDALSSLALVYLKQGKKTHYRAMLERAVMVKARQTPPAEQPKPRLAPPEPPGEPTLKPEAPEPARSVTPKGQPELRKEPEPKEVFVLESKKKRGPLGNLHIDGQVKNNTSKTVRRVEVSLVAFNAEGKPFDPPMTYRGPWELRPGEKAPFSIDVADKNDNVERFDLKPTWEPIQE